MTYRGGVVTGVLATTFVAVAAWWVFLRPVPEPVATKSPPIPVVVSKEDQFYLLTLEKKAIDVLDVTYSDITRKKSHRTSFFGGEVMIPPGQTIIVSAPLNGLIRMIDDKPPLIGQRVTKGDVLFEILPLLTPEGIASIAGAKIDADGAVKNAETQVIAAEKNLVRAKMLLMDDVGSKQRVDDAEAAEQIAKRTLKAAEERQALLTRVAKEVQKGVAAPITLTAPTTGIIRTLSAAEDQKVPGGAPLFEVLDLSTVWVRVAVFAGELPEVNLDAPAQVGSLSLVEKFQTRSLLFFNGQLVILKIEEKEKSVEAPRVNAPPSANPLVGSVDLYYRLDNSQTKYSPGHRVGVTLSLKAEANPLTVPWGAVLYDTIGGAWVYEPIGERSFIRRRVRVQFVDGETAILSEGPPEGTRVVIDGANELFGAETGYSK